MLLRADHLSRQTDRHESFDNPRRIAAKRCSTSASMCGSRATQRDGSAAATEKAATAHHRGRPRCSDKHSGHSGAMPATKIGSPADLLLVLDAPWALEPRVRSFCFKRNSDAYKVPEHV